MNYNWAVWMNNRIIGYVRSKSEFEAVKIAKENFIKDEKNYFIERVYLGNPIPVEKDFCFSSSFANDYTGNNL